MTNHTKYVILELYLINTQGVVKLDSKYQEFFNILPKHALLPIIRVVPIKFDKITTNLLAYVFIQQGIIKKIILDNMKECTAKIVRQQLATVGEGKDHLEILDMDISDECRIFLDSFLFFKSKYSKIVTSDILTAYVSYLMISDVRLGCYKFFKDCIYVKEYDTIINDLYSQLSESIGITRSDVLIDYGEYLTDPLIYKHYDYSGREELVQNCIDILCRMNKSNVLLVGNPGVGKTSIVYEICNIISSSDCPDQLKSFNVFSLSLAKLVGGTTFRGDLENRLDSIITELKTNNIILFVDEMQSFVSKDSDSRVFQNALKSYLSESSKMIGCTTNEEYKVIESDKAFERRFTKVIVPEMTTSETLNVLQHDLKKYSNFHNIHIDNEILEYIVNKCNIHIRNRYFPDKAFDILDKVCVRCSRENLDCIALSDVDIEINQFCNTINTSDIQYVNESEDYMKKIIFGQDSIIENVCNYMRRYALHVNDNSRPIASLLFVGPTGTGKTELCKQMAGRFFSDESFIRYDMSEFMEPHSVSKIIGSPPGYVGYDRGGSLTELVKHNPYSLILFDEIEKSHKDVINILLQIMDDGRLTDSMGITTDFRNCIIVMTSNIGCKEYINKNSLGFIDNTRTDKSVIRNAIADFFSPEFLNRLDDIMYFNSISQDVLDNIFNKNVGEFIGRYKNSGISLSIDDKTLNELKKRCFNEKNGVRYIKNKIAQNLEPYIFRKISNGEKSVSFENYDFGEK